MESVPTNFQEWYHCITISCGIELTPQFIDERLKALHNPQDSYTAAFTKQYGASHLQNVIGWYKQAATMANKN
jgi:hypothetical protein